MAVEVGRNPTAFPCHECDCVNGESSKPKWAIPGVVPATKQCLRQLVNERSATMCGLFPHWQQGVMYSDGGLRNQPAIFLSSMTAIQAYLNEDGETT